MKLPKNFKFKCVKKINKKQMTCSFEFKLTFKSMMILRYYQFLLLYITCFNLITNFHCYWINKILRNK